MKKQKMLEPICECGHSGYVHWALTIFTPGKELMYACENCECKNFKEASKLLQKIYEKINS